MPASRKQSEKAVVFLLPLSTAANRFVASFSQALSEQGYNWRHGA
jgi:hypothetical protein